MAGHQIHDDLDAAGVRLPDQGDEVVVVTEALVHAVVVDDVIAAVRPAGHVHRIQPDGRHADGADVVQAGNDTLQVAIAVSVAILVGRRINLVEDGVGEPTGLRLFLGCRTCDCQDAGQSDDQSFLHIFSLMTVQS